MYMYYLILSESPPLNAPNSLVENSTATHPVFLLYDIDALLNLSTNWLHLVTVPYFGV